ncbi:MAG: hypothetical protein AB8B99_17430 [Phormidesmis sp.]
MKPVIFATTVALTAAISSVLGAVAPSAQALEDTQALSAHTIAFQKTASETAYEATDPRYQVEGSNAKIEEDVTQNKGRRRGFRRGGFRRRGFRRRGFRRY